MSASTADMIRRRRAIMGSYGRPQVTEEEINGVMSTEERAALTEQMANAPIGSKAMPFKPENEAENPEWAKRLASPTPGYEDPPDVIAAKELPRPGSIPAQVGQMAMGAAKELPKPPPAPLAGDTRDEDELYEAQDADRRSHLTAGMELAGRQLVGGITRTPVGQGIGAAPSRVPGAQQAIKSRREQAAELIRQKRQGVMDESALKLQDSQTQRNLREPAPKGGVDYSDIKKGELELKKETLAETIRKNRAKEAKGAGPKKFEDIPPGFEVADGSIPGKETRRDFSKLVTSAERMKGLTGQMRSALSGTSGTSRVLDPAVRTKLQQLGKMIQIEAKDVAGLGALSGPDMALMEAMASDPTSIQSNLTVDLPAMLAQLDKWADNSVDAKTKGTGIRRKAAPTQTPGTRSVGGVTYEKRGDGKWYPVGGG